MEIDKTAICFPTSYDADDLKVIQGKTHAELLRLFTVYYFSTHAELHQALCAELTWKLRITWKNRIIGQTYSQAILEMTSLQRTTTARFLRFSPLPSPAEYICGCLFWELSLSACQQTLGHRLPHTLVALSMGTYLKEDNSHRLTVCMAREFEASLYRPSSPSQPKPAADFWRLGAALHSWCV